MKMKMAGLVMAWCGIWGGGIVCGVPTVSDGFNRADNPSSLGSTAEGYVWGIRNITGQSADYTPGIKTGRLWWSAPGWNYNNVAYLSDSATFMKNFELEFDFATYSVNGGTRPVTVHFRMPTAGAIIYDGNGPAGYAIGIQQVNYATATISLTSNFGTGISQTVNTGGPGAHLKIIALDDTIRVLVNGTERINYMDTTSNPARTAAGYFSFYNGNADDQQGLDNLAITIRPVAATPTFTPAGGFLKGSQTVSIGCATAEAVIRFTLDGSDPTASSPQYTGPIPVTLAITIKARAWATDMDPSAVATATFTFPPMGLASDTFGRADAPREVGRTDQGYAWNRMGYGDPNTTYNPGIKSGRLWFEPGDWNKNDAITLSGMPPLKNFTMEYDYVTLETGGASRAIGAYIRTELNQLPNDQSNVKGYAIYTRQTAADTVQVSLANSSYGIGVTQAVQTGGPGCHVRIAADGNTIKVYINNNPVPTIDFSDITNNPGKYSSGYISFYGGNSPDRQGIDNLIVTPQAGLIHDGFSRPDAPKNLGRTDQGFTWVRLQYGDPNATYNPGIKDGRLWFDPGDWNKNDGVILSGIPAVKDFTLEYDYVTLETTGASRAIAAFIRTPSGELPDEWPNIPGYAIYVRQINYNNVTVRLANSSYGISVSSDVLTGGPGCHVKIVAQGTTIKVYINNSSSPAIDFTDTTANPGKDTAGYLAFNGGNSPDRQGIDNLTLVPAAGPAVFAGWYDHVTWSSSLPTALAMAGAKNSVLLTDYEPIASIQAYMNDAEVCGIPVVLGVHEEVRSANWNGLIAKVDMFKDHPALSGWFIFDDTIDVATQLPLAQTAAGIIRARSNKPITLDVSNSGLDINVPYDFRNTFDILMLYSYPFYMGYPEFQGLEGERGWKDDCTRASEHAAAIGKPLYLFLQGSGKIPWWPDTRRLPTFREERFMIFYSFFLNAAAIEFFADYVLESTIAIPTDPYPFDGSVWKQEVEIPLQQEVNLVGTAIGAGPIAGGVNCTNATIQVRLYLDPGTGQYHLFAINPGGGEENGTFTVNVPVPVEKVVPIHVPLFDSQSPRPVENSAFSDTLSPYDVHHYLLEVSDNLQSNLYLNVPGDANGDAKVDVSDLGILAAHYGTTSGAMWDMGDFNGDGKVDVSDLGILAANYGQPMAASLRFAETGALLNFNDEALKEATTTSPFGCSSGGLPLIIGLGLNSVLLSHLHNRNQ